MLQTLYKKGVSYSHDCGFRSHLGVEKIKRVNNKAEPIGYRLFEIVYSV